MMRKEFINTASFMDLDSGNQTTSQYSSDNSQSPSSNSNYYSSSSHSPLTFTTLEVQQQPIYLSSHSPHLTATIDAAGILNPHVHMVQIPMVTSQPKLVILEEPADKFRFRYSSEMHGTHGSLMGAMTRKNQKSYPQVKLEGYPGKAVIRCTLYQERQSNPSPHSHSLVVRKNDRDECDPHYFEVDGAANMTTIKCQGMGIIHTAKKDIKEALKTKLEALWKKDAHAEVGRAKMKEFSDKAEMEAKSMNLNQVRLCFEALRKEANGTYSPICAPVYSKPINNMKSALTGEVKICRLSAAVSSAEGGDDLFLLVEKVNKKNIKVRFFEEENGETVWQDWGIFTENDVHHQYAIALRTPPYMNKDIEHVVNVKIQLVRESDKDCSEPMDFKYKPRHAVSSRKRRRLSTATLSSSELPATFDYNLSSVSPSEGSDGMSISTEFGREAIIKDLTSPQLTSTEFKICEKDLRGDSCDLSAFISVIDKNSDELRKIMDENILNNFEQMPLEDVVCDGVSSSERPRPTMMNDDDLVIRQFKDFMNKVSNNEWTIQQAKENMERMLALYEKKKKESLINNLISTGNIKHTQVFFHILERIDFFEPLKSLEGSDSPLYTACLMNKPVFIRSLLNYECNPNTYDVNTGDTPLHIAADENFLECAKAIITSCKDKNIALDINLANFEGMTCLHKAIRRGHFEMVKLLINEGRASAKLAISKTGNNALMLAVEYKQQKIAEYLLESTEVKSTAKNSSGLTALEMAKSNGEEDIFKMLMRNMKISEQPEIKEESEDDSDSQSTDTAEYIQWDESFITKLSKVLGNRWYQLAEALELSYVTNLFNEPSEFLKYVSQNEVHKNSSKLKFSEYVSKMEGSTEVERKAIDQILGLQ